MQAEPTLVRTDIAVYPEAGYFRRQGTLVLFQDRLAFVGSYASSLGVGVGGLLGGAIGRGYATSSAPAKALKGGHGVVSVQLAELTGVTVSRSRRGRASGLLISAAGGADLRFTCGRALEWVSDIARLLEESGRLVTPVADGVMVR